MTTILRKVDVWMQDGEACYYVADSYVAADQLPAGMTRYYRITEGGEEIFLGTLPDYENVRGGVGGNEEALFSWIAADGQNILVIDSDTNDFLTPGFDFNQGLAA